MIRFALFLALVFAVGCGTQAPPVQNPAGVPLGGQPGGHIGPHG